MLTGILLVVLGIRDIITQRKQAKMVAQGGESAEHSSETPLSPIARWREIIGVAAVTGIVPCPAVALIVLFCLLNSMVALSLLGALVICIGMTITNVAFGIAAVAFRKGIDKGSAHTKIATKIYTVGFGTDAVQQYVRWTGVKSHYIKAIAAYLQGLSSFVGTLCILRLWLCGNQTGIYGRRFRRPFPSFS